MEECNYFFILYNTFDKSDYKLYLLKDFRIILKLSKKYRGLRIKQYLLNGIVTKIKLKLV